MSGWLEVRVRRYADGGGQCIARRPRSRWPDVPLKSIPDYVRDEDVPKWFESLQAADSGVGSQPQGGDQDEDEKAPPGAFRKRRSRRSATQVQRLIRQHGLDELWVFGFGGEGCRDYGQLMRLVTGFMRDVAPSYFKPAQAPARAVVRSRLGALGGPDPTSDGEGGASWPWVMVPEPHPGGHGWHWNLATRGTMDWTMAKRNALKIAWTRYVVRHAPEYGPPGGTRLLRVSWPTRNQRRSAKGLAKYLAKYLAKSFEEGGVPVGRHRFTRSQGVRDEVESYQVARHIIGSDLTTVYDFLGAMGVRPSRIYWLGESDDPRLPSTEWSGPPMVVAEWDDDDPPLDV